MGYCVDMYFENVKFKEENATKVINALKKLNNEYLTPQRDWCRFDNDLDDPIEIFEDIGYELIQKDGFYVIDYFLREKLGSHEMLLKTIEEFMEPGSVKYVGEDGSVWYQHLNKEQKLNGFSLEEYELAVNRFIEGDCESDFTNQDFIELFSHIKNMEKKLNKSKEQRNKYIASVYDRPGVGGWSDIIKKCDDEIEGIK